MANTKGLTEINLQQDYEELMDIILRDKVDNKPRSYMTNNEFTFNLITEPGYTVTEILEKPIYVMSSNTRFILNVLVKLRNLSATLYKLELKEYKDTIYLLSNDTVNLINKFPEYKDYLQTALDRIKHLFNLI